MARRLLRLIRGEYGFAARWSGPASGGRAGLRPVRQPAGGSRLGLNAYANTRMLAYALIFAYDGRRARMRSLPMIITVVAHKGGVGKTTTALHLAAYLREKLGSVALVDQDPNESAIEYAYFREEGLPFRVMTPEEEFEGEENFVYDSQGRLSDEDLADVVELSDFVVIPSEADRMSLNTVGLLREDLARVGGVPHKVLLVRVPWYEARFYCPGMGVLEETGVPHFSQVIEERRAFRLASDEGRLVHQTRRRGARDGWMEYRSVGEELLRTVAQLREAGV